CFRRTKHFRLNLSTHHRYGDGIHTLLPEQVRGVEHVYIRSVVAHCNDSLYPQLRREDTSGGPLVRLDAWAQFDDLPGLGYRELSRHLGRLDFAKYRCSRVLAVGCSAVVEGDARAFSLCLNTERVEMSGVGHHLLD